MRNSSTAYRLWRLRTGDSWRVMMKQQSAMLKQPLPGIFRGLPSLVTLSEKPDRLFLNA